MSLLDKAKAYQPKDRKRPTLTNDDEELAVAWLRGDISLAHLRAAYTDVDANGKTKYLKADGAIWQIIAEVARKFFRQGIIQESKNNDKDFDVPTV